jgi:hypothetical protein
MRSRSSPVRTLTAIAAVALLWLVSVAPALAAPTPRRGAAGPVCDPQTTTLRKLARMPKSFGGPLKRPSTRALAGLTDVTARLLRGSRPSLNSDEAAIQNDAPAARTDEDDRLVPCLRPLGVLAGSVDARPRSHAFSPKSPRGPPFTA